MSEELKLRIISGVILAIIVLAAAWLGGVYFAIIAQIIGLLVFYEWATITGIAKSDMRAYILGWIVMAGIVASGLFSGIEETLLALVGAVVVCLMFVVAQKRSYWLPGGVLYAGLSAVSLAALRGNDFAGLVAIIFLFAVVWGTDIAAYFVGRAIGGPKLAPRISPGKTWSGAIGGTVVGILVSGLVLLAIFETPGWMTVIAAAVLSILSQVGDLFESYIKRRFGVKDSSRLIPGHGGVMDRVDGLVFACFGAFALSVVVLYLRGVGEVSLGALFLAAI